MKVRELIEVLEEFDGNAEVMLATQPNWPFECHICGIVDVEDENKVLIGEGNQIGYLSGEGREALGW